MKFYNGNYFQFKEPNEKQLCLFLSTKFCGTFINTRKRYYVLMKDRVQEAIAVN